MQYPAELKALDRWCIVHKQSKTIADEDGNPYCKQADAQFGTFDQIKHAITAVTCLGIYLGKGKEGSLLEHSIPPDVICIDLDDMFTAEGELTIGGKRNTFFTTLCALTYTERSISGKGVHLFFRGTLHKQYVSIETTDKVEIYQPSGRLIVMGTHIPTSPLVLADFASPDVQSLVNGLIALNPKHKPSGKYPHRDDDYNGLAEGEGRHNALFGIASSLVGQKLPQYEVLARLLAADAKNSPPMGFEYCQRMVDGLLVKEQEKEMVHEHLRTTIHHIQSNGSWYDLNNKQVMSTQSLITKYRNKGFTGSRGNKKLGMPPGLPVLTEWLSSHPEFITVNGVGWLPVPYGTPITEVIHDNKKTYSNMWQEYAIEPQPGPIDLWLDLADHLCNHNQEYVAILLDWLAYTVQYPHKKINWQVVISGTQGAGKDNFFKPLGKIYGSNGGAIGLIDGKALASDFQDAFYAKKLMIITEVSNIRDTTLDYVKRLCSTEAIERISLNPKGLPLIDQINVYSIAFLTNDLAAIRCDATERRFFMLDCRTKQAEHTIMPYINWIDGGGSAAVFDYLLKRDVSKFNTSEVIKTEHFYNMFEATRTYEETSLDALAVSRTGIFAHDFLRVLDVQTALRLQHQEVSHSQVLVALHSAGYEKVRTDVKDVANGKPRRASKGVDGKMMHKDDWYGIADNEHMVSRSGSKLYTAISEVEQKIEKDQINRKF